ncbi:MAG TPA: acyl carrier protein [bacterium]|nr:acyl carrier protein [bacterium]HPS30148.1 acyl carrier protein [bacterium]
MKREEIIAKIISFMSEEFEVDPSTIQPDANLMQTLDLDSLDLVDLVVIIEKNFGFKVEAKDFVNIKTFNDFYDYVCTKLEKPAE